MEEMADMLSVLHPKNAKKMWVEFRGAARKARQPEPSIPLEQDVDRLKGIVSRIPGVAIRHAPKAVEPPEPD